MSSKDKIFPQETSNGWTENKNLVLYELKQLNSGIEKLEIKLDEKHTILSNDISELRTDVTTLKVKARTWGAVGGAIIAFIVTVLIKVFG